MPEYLFTQSDKKHSLGRKVPNVLCTRKRKNWGFFGENFLKVWKFSAQSTKLKKKIFVPEVLPKRCSAHVIYRVEKTDGNFVPNLREKMLKCREKNLSNQKEQERSVPHLECIFENTVEIFSAGAWRFQLTFRKKRVSLRKTCQNALCTRKMKNWDFSRKVLLKAWKFLAQSTRKETPNAWARIIWAHSPTKKPKSLREKMYKNDFCTRKITKADFCARISFRVWKFPARNTCKKKWFFWKKYQVVPFYTYFELLRSMPKIFNSSCEKHLYGVQEKWYSFRKKKQLERFSAHLEFFFKNTAEKFLVNDWNVWSHSPKKRSVLRKDVPKVFSTQKKEKLRISLVKFCSQFGSFLLKREKWHKLEKIPK